MPNQPSAAAIARPSNTPSNHPSNPLSTSSNSLATHPPITPPLLEGSVGVGSPSPPTGGSAVGTPFLSEPTPIWNGKLFLMSGGGSRRFFRVGV